MREPRLTQSRLAPVVLALHSKARVSGRSHSYYRYPARFPPDFAREAITAFTRPGDVVLDPFMGGGTSAVEALALGRKFIGVDVNPISHFVSKVKTTPLSDRDASILLDWAEGSTSIGSPGRGNDPDRGWAEALRNTPWWLRRQIGNQLETSKGLGNRRQVDFARCSILRTAQWALDNRSRLATGAEFRAMHRKQLGEMLSSAPRLGDGTFGVGHVSTNRRLLCRSASGLELDHRIPAGWKPVKLVLTSPPYPGVHVLYHRWQVSGRRETAAPFWIAGHEDGHPASFYTMGPRYANDLSDYLVEYESSLRSIAKMLSSGSTIVQLLGFSSPQTQLGPVLEVIESAGFVSVQSHRGGNRAGLHWRHVPNRKWYTAGIRGASGSEVLLVHRLKAG
jgi:hypothetical protein